MQKDNKRLIWLGAFMLVTVWAFVLFHPRLYHPEELGLMDVPYNFAHYGKLANPAYEHLGEGNWDLIYTHPPVHYFFIGVWMWLTNMHYALGIMPALYFTLSLLIAGSMKLKFHERLTLMVAPFILIAACLNTHVNFTIRPEMTLTLCWIAGLYALEKGRLENWRLSFMGLGTFLVVLGSMHHYWAFPAFFGIIVYLFLAWKENSRQKAFKSIGTIIGSGLAIGVPFLLFFIIPYFSEIYEMSSSSGPEYDDVKFSLINNLMIHLETHQFVNGVMRHMFSPTWLHLWMIPVGAVSVAGLLLFKYTRVIAATALPFIFILTFIIKNKKEYYVFPEWFLFNLLFFTLITLLIKWLWRNKPELEKRNMTIIFSVMLFIVFLFSKLFYIVFNGDIAPVHPMETVRAAMQKSTNENTLVGGMLETWFISGASKWYCEEAGLMDRNFPDESTYLSKPDYFAIYDVGDNESFWNKLIPSYYEQKTLNVSRVLFGMHTSNMAMLTAKEEPSPVFYDLKVNDILEYETDPNGDYIIGSFISIGTPPKMKYLKFTKNLIPTFSPIKGLFKVRATVPGIKPVKFLVMFALTKEDFDVIKPSFEKNIRRLEYTRASMKKYTYRELINSVENYDPVVQFYRSQEDALKD